MNKANSPFGAANPNITTLLIHVSSSSLEEEYSEEKMSGHDDEANGDAKVGKATGRISRFSKYVAVEKLIVLLVRIRPLRTYSFMELIYSSTLSPRVCWLPFYSPSLHICKFVMHGCDS
ncbi:hypothetical protein POM88_050773 [Heracleum sosnowskyi]|uniref:Uncharacterized protein n=1 Tax=Heracleum sosnowskyi TaxID=360622 RepID=A0AAD8GYA3_9APIA|nr:hypothetical protein POM88_050773 [Heracleum sosnowskyi]